MKNKLIKIGEIAKQAGVLNSTVRYYTNVGLLEEETRSQGKYRLYNKTQTLDQLKKILELKRQGLTLCEIRSRMDQDVEPERVFKDHPVFFAYLFGSRVKGNVTALSDTDIAVFLDEQLTPDECFQARLKLASDLAVAYKTDKIDLVVLNDSPLVLSFEVISTGEILYCADESKRVGYESKIMSLYFDQQYYHQRHSQSIINRIAREGIL